MEFVIILGALFVIGFVAWNIYQADKKKKDLANSTWPFPTKAEDLPQEKPKAKRRNFTKKPASAKAVKKAPAKKTKK